MNLTQHGEIICLCGSTKFKREYEYIEKILTIQGNIILTCGFFGHSDGWPYDPNNSIKEGLDSLHLDKIDLADKVIVINPGGYIGESTKKEIEYAKETNTPVVTLEGIEK